MKLALITNNWNFLSPIKAELENHTQHIFEQYWPTNNEVINWANIMSLLDWADIAFFDFAQPPLLAISNLAVKKCKYVVRVLGLEVFHNIQHVNWQNIDYVVFISEHQQQRFCERIPSTNRSKTHKVINLGVNVDTFTLPERKEYGYNICQVGNFLPHKRHYETIQMFKQLVERSPAHQKWNLHLHHATTGSWRSSLQHEYLTFCKELVEDLDLTDIVHFYDAIADWQNGGGAEFFLDKDIIISNSQMEGYHKTPLEGMSCGLHPVVNCWRGADQIYPKTHVFKTFCSALAMIRTWAGLLDKMKRTLSEAHRQHVLKYHNEKNMAKRLIRLLEMVCYDYAPSYLMKTAKEEELVVR